MLLPKKGEIEIKLLEYLMVSKEITDPIKDPNQTSTKKCCERYILE